MAGCCDDELEPVEKFPVAPPPCTDESCSVGWLDLRTSNGRVTPYSKLVGGPNNGDFIETLATGETVCGVLRTFRDADENCLGQGILLTNNPAPIDVTQCVDEDGNELYTNSIRAVVDSQGRCSLGALPIALQDVVCAEDEGCEGLFPDAEQGTVYGSQQDGGCGPNVCIEFTNPSCYPVIVQPKVTVEGWKLGVGNVVYNIQRNVNGTFGPLEPVGNGVPSCSLIAAGTGDTSSSLDTTASAGDPAHEHGGLAHTHEGPSHSHTLNCDDAFNTGSQTIDQPPLEVPAGTTITYCITGQLNYADDVADPGVLDFGKVRLCLDWKSKVTPETIADLEATL